VFLQLSEGEREVRHKPIWRKGKNGARWRFSPRKWDDGSDIAKFRRAEAAPAHGTVGTAVVEDEKLTREVVS
jgi:hypothetical protein